MPDLHFKVSGLAPGMHGMMPLLNFQLEITNTPANEPISSVILQAQIQFHAKQRRYLPSEKEKLTELFGEPERWGDTLRTKLWTLANTTVRPFAGSTTALLTIPCTFDLNVMATKYFYALEEGEIPLLFHFSGTIFYESADERLQVQPISGNKECLWRMPVSAWRDLMDHHYPDTAWLTLSRAAFDRLYAYRRTHGIATWDETIEQLLPAMEEAEVTP